MRISTVSGLCLLAFQSIACAPESESTYYGNTGGTQSGSGGAGVGGTQGTGATNAGTGSVGSGGEGLGGAANSGGGSTGGASGSIACTGNEILCEDFEDTAADALPGSPWLPRGSSCQYGSFKMGVTAENAHDSSHSLKVTDTSYAECRLAAPIGEHDDFWVRAFVYWDAAIDFSNREVLDMDLLPASGLNKDDPAVRFGNRSKAPCTESAGPQITIIGVAGGEQTGCSTTKAIPKGKWYCFEAHVQQSTNITVQTYIDRTPLQYTSTGKPVTDSISTPSAPTEKLNHLRLGMFGTTATTGNLYLDDVAVSTTRLSCGL